jgi:hypothetical protein
MQFILLLLAVFSLNVYAEGLVHNPDKKKLDAKCEQATLDDKGELLKPDVTLTYALYVQDSRPYNSGSAIRLLSNSDCRFFNIISFYPDIPDGQYYLYVIAAASKDNKIGYSMPGTATPFEISRGAVVVDPIPSIQVPAAPGPVTLMER